MKRILLVFSLMLLPAMVYAQKSLKHISGLSHLASTVSVSEKEVVSGFSSNRTSNSIIHLLNRNSLSDLFYGGGLMRALDEGLNNVANTAIVMQNGENNLVQVNQSGHSNVAVLEQAGNNIRNTVTQSGTGNIYGSKLTGNNHELDVSQIGNHNLYLFEYNSSKPLKHSVEQIGNNLKAVQIGKTSKPFGIKEYGKGMHIIIRHYHY